VRKAILKDRPIRDADVQLLSRELSPSELEGIHRYRAAAAAAASSTATYDALLDDALQETRKTFKTLAARERFQTALAHASATLFLSAPGYLKNQPIGQARLEQLERGLLRFYSRMATKPTPFGRFCLVTAGETRRSAASAAGLRIEGSAEPRTSVRLNKRLFPLLWELLLERPEVQSNLNVRLNPSLSIENGTIVFLALNNGSEQITRIGANAPLLAVLKVAERHCPCGVADLAAAVGSASDKVQDESAVRAYLGRLSETQLLSHVPVVQDQDAEWDVSLARRCSAVDDNVLRMVAEHLSGARVRLDLFSQASAAERVVVEREIREAINACFLVVGGRRIPDNVPIFYEDATADMTVTLGIDRSLAGAVAKAAEFSLQMSRLAWPREDMAALREMYDRSYPDTDKPIPLLRFFEVVYRAQKEALRRQAEGNAEPVNTTVGQERSTQSVSLLASINGARHQLREMIGVRMRENPEAQEVAVSAADLDSVIKAVPPITKGPISLSIFCNLLRPRLPTEGWRVMIPNGVSLPGFGKYFSRFLHLMRPAIAEGLGAEFECEHTHVIAEISGDGHFNANLHPTYIKHQVRYPVQRAANLRGAIDCRDLVVERDVTDPFTLVLRDTKTAAYVVPVDLGFQSIHLRPTLHQLLCKFQTPGGSSVPLPSGLRRSSTVVGSISASPTVPTPIREVPARASTDAELRERVAYRPRVVYENCVVIARRQWVVPCELLPGLAPSETSGASIRRVQDWQELLGIPGRVFIHVRPLAPYAASRDQVRGRADATEPIATPSASADSSRNTRSKLRRDDHKPQFIDFSMPLLARLFLRIGSGLTNHELVIEEILPGLDEASSTVEGSFVSECMLQFGQSAEGHTGNPCRHEIDLVAQRSVAK